MCFKGAYFVGPAIAFGNLSRHKKVTTSQDDEAICMRCELFALELSRVEKIINLNQIPGSLQEDLKWFWLAKSLLHVEDEG